MSKKIDQVKTILAEMDRAIIAYSGGIDSTLMAKIAFDVLGENAIAITADSPSLLPEDLAEAKAQAEVIGISHRIIQTDELDNPNYNSNPVNRCYFCKSELYDRLKPLALEMGYPYVLDGVNADDLQDYRPGIQAAKERGTRSPLAEAGLTKLDVRMATQELRLPWWDKPAQPCLSSRFPYGEGITIEKLQRVAQAERYLRNLGYRTLRVRSEGETAKIELPISQIQAFINQEDLKALIESFKSFGYTFITLDLEGFQSGKLNQLLNLTQQA